MHIPQTYINVIIWRTAKSPNSCSNTLYSASQTDRTEMIYKNHENIGQHFPLKFPLQTDPHWINCLITKWKTSVSLLDYGCFVKGASTWFMCSLKITQQMVMLLMSTVYSTSLWKGLHHCNLKWIILILLFLDFKKYILYLLWWVINPET